MDSLNVYLNDRLVGRLTDDGGILAFAYGSEYASDLDNEPLSYSLPLRNEPFDHAEEVLGGPGIVASFRLLRELSLPASDTLELLRRIIFNFLVGNGDAHGKNFSVLYHGRKSALAPMYDVMSTAVYPDVSKRMAMKIDGEYSFRWITRGKFMRMAETLGFSRKTMAKEIDRMSSRILGKAPKLAEKLNAGFPSGCYRRICEGIVKRASQVMLKQ